MTHAQLIDLLCVYVRVCVSRKTGGWGTLYSLNPHCHIVQEGACQHRLIHSGDERVYQPRYLHTETYAARTSEKSSVQMVFVGNHIRLLLSRVNSFWHWLRDHKATRKWRA